MLIQLVLFVLFMHTCAPYAQDDETVAFLTSSAYPVTLIFALIFFLLSAYTNPGIIIGNEAVQLKKAQDYELRHNREKSRQLG